jgi:hypothetical protein
MNLNNEVYVVIKSKLFLKKNIDDIEMIRVCSSVEALGELALKSEKCWDEYYVEKVPIDGEVNGNKY